VGEASLDNPLEYDTIPAARHENFNLSKPYVADLSRLSTNRITQDRDFSYLLGEIKRFEKQQAEKCISLNEQKRLKEKQEADDRAKARKKELAARPEPSGKVYEIKLKDVDLPGLPPPVAWTNHVAEVKSTNAPGSIVITKSTGAAANQAAVPAGHPIVKSGSDEADDDETASTDGPPPPDIALDETRRLMLDYLEMLSRDGNGSLLDRAKKRN
jgi:hypothetical protein